MLDVGLTVAYLVLPAVAWWLSKSLTWLAVRIAFGFGIAGTAVQTTIAFGWGWNLFRLQMLVLGVLAVVAALAAVGRRRRASTLRRQVIVIGVPMLAIGAYLIAMRLLAPGQPGPLTGVGYFINHPLAEDNAKWLNLSSQLAAGRDLVFNGYAGGPLILIMVMMATLISVLSMLLLGGVNEVAVAVNTIIGTQFLLIALVPVALAPFAERIVPIPRRVKDGAAQLVPAPVIWSAVVVLFVASAVVTSYGHLSLQFVLIVLVLWAGVFLVGGGGARSRLLMTLVVATTASVWLPLNILGIVLLVGCLLVTVRGRDWIGVVLVVVTVAATWDALISSTLYLLGIDLGAPAAGSDAGSSGGGVDAGSGSFQQLATASSLFEAPGGTEEVQPLVGGLALASLLLTVAWYSKNRIAERWHAAVPFFPVVAMVGYLLFLTLGDAIVTGGSPHYGVHKLAFAATIMTICATLPVALIALEGRAQGMTMLRWFAVGAVVLLLSLDTILPRGLSALSPQLWPSVDAAHPVFWSAAEVKKTADQPIDSLPLACLFAPPTGSVPSGLPEGQQSYNCTRLMIGLNGLEGHVGILDSWLQTDWLSNAPSWDKAHASLAKDEAGIRNRLMIVTNTDGSLAGLTPLGSLLDRYPPQPS